MKIFSYEEFTEGRKVPKMKDFDTVAGMLKSLINARDDEWLKAAAFFGSFVFKCHNVGSDIDLLIISDGLISIDRENFLRSLSRMASSYNISLDILLLSESDINPKRITYCNAGDMLAAFRFFKGISIIKGDPEKYFSWIEYGSDYKESLKNFLIQISEELIYDSSNYIIGQNDCSISFLAMNKVCLITRMFSWYYKKEISWCDRLIPEVFLLENISPWGRILHDNISYFHRTLSDPEYYPKNETAHRDNLKRLSSNFRNYFGDFVRKNIEALD